MRGSAKFRGLAIGLVLGSMATLASVSFAQGDGDLFGTTSSVFVDIADNNIGEFAVLNFDELSSSQSTAVSLSHTSSYSGVDGNGVDRTMTFNANGSAEAIFQLGQVPQLKSMVSGSLSNSFYSENNDLFADGGPPTVLNIIASSSFTEVLQYGGTATSYNSKYILNLSGSITGQDAFNVVNLKHANEPNQTFTFFSAGSYNLKLVSDAFVHGGSAQTITLTLDSYYQPATEFLVDGSTTSGAALFDNTLTLEGIDLRDSDTGQLLPANEITGASGASYTVIAAVPEPSSFLLVVLGVGATILRRRK